MNKITKTLKQLGLGLALVALPAATSFGSNSTNWLDNTISPVSNPIFFEDPNVTSEIRPVYMYHVLPNTFHFQGGSVPLGGHVQVAAVQARYALTDRLGLIATKDGYIAFQPSHTLAHTYGWGDLGAGAKYALIYDLDDQFILTPGFTIILPTGDQRVFQGHGDGVWNVFVSTEKGWNNFHATASLGFSIPNDFAQNTAQMHYSAQLDYYACQWFIPFVVANGYTILSNGDNKLLGAVPLNAEMYDLINFGATDVAGTTEATIGCGWRTRIIKSVDAGAAFEAGVVNPKGIFESRVTVDAIWRF